MLEVLRQDYIRTARAKGLPRRQVVMKHALANALIPITTVIGIIVSLLISGSVVTETLFSIPGIGQLLTQAVLNRDYPMVQGGLLIVTALLVLVNIWSMSATRCSIRGCAMMPPDTLADRPRTSRSAASRRRRCSACCITGCSSPGWRCSASSCWPRSLAPWIAPIDPNKLAMRYKLPAAELGLIRSAPTISAAACGRA